MIFSENMPDYICNNWYRPIPLVIRYSVGLCIDIMISETVKFFKQLRHAMKGKTLQNKWAKYSNVR